MDLDFVEIKIRDKSRYSVEIYPEFKTKRSNDLMIRGKSFYAFWNEDTGLWSTDEYELYEAVDKMLYKAVENIKEENRHGTVIRYMQDYSSGILSRWRKFCKEVSDSYHDLDTKIIFGNSKTKKTDYASIKLPYPLRECDITAYDVLMTVLYDKEERRKIEWAIGSIIAGDSKDIQKFFVLYGSAGSGKSTVLKIIKTLFGDYCGSFSAKDLGDRSNQFALDTLASNPLLAIDNEGDLSRLDDNTRINAIVSHDSLKVNEKFKSTYTLIFRTMLFIATNSPVRITDSKSGLLRRLIDISPSGRLLEFNKYNELMMKIPFELPGIAYHCLQVYLKYGKNYYDAYKPTKMMDETNDMFNFVQDMFWYWGEEDSVSLAKAWTDYKAWCEDSGVTYPLKKRVFKAELMNYFKNFEEHPNKNECNVYSGILKDKLKVRGYLQEQKVKNWLDLKEQDSLLDNELSECKAQYATEEGIPRAKWENVKTKMVDIDSKKLHYVKPPKNHIVIDFDIKNPDGEKDVVLNMEAASKFPQTYAELSKGGAGIHLHYIYDGDVDLLSRIYDEEVEVKVFKGNASLRRRLSKCNDIPITTINSGLPLKGDNKKMIDTKSVENERHLRVMLKKCLNKENHGHTKPEVDFMNKLLSDAYQNNLSYDVRDMRPAIISFAMDSTNQKQACFDLASKFKYCSKDHEDGEKENFAGTDDWNEAPIVFFDVEVFPNLFIICWKKLGEDNKVVRMINPTPEEVKKLFAFRLVGFNNRKYDNHIIYARSMGYTNKELYNMSQAIIGKKNGAFLGEAYGLSYTDILDYCSNKNKMSLKKWEIKLGIFHLENAYPWDEPVVEEHWDEIAYYCCNDVIATEAVWNATQADFRGRQILAELSGLTVNDTSNTHTQQIIFGNDRNPQREFNCPDLSEEFPGYEFKNGVSTFMDEIVGEGGWNYSNPGMYYDGVCEDVSGMHPASIYAMMLFGPEYTERYYDLVRARTHIKHKEYDKVREMFDGRLAKYLGSEKEAEELSNALKTPINSVYGLTAAHFLNRCRDPRNKDNVVAKRGALFMITLKNEVINKGYKVFHCKTDSIKVANPDDYILNFIEDYGKKYGYTFEIEDKFERICIVNDSTFIARFDDGQWYAKASQFAHPYVFKSLFTHEEIEFKDLCETKQVKGALYLDMNEGLPDVSEFEKEKKKYLAACKKNKEEPNFEYLEELNLEIAAGHNYHFVGRVGLFTPVVDGSGGGLLMSSTDGGETFSAVQGTKGYRWFESDTIRDLGIEDRVDMQYFDNLANASIDTINKYGDFDKFVNLPHNEYVKYIDEMNDVDSIPF